MDHDPSMLLAAQPLYNNAKIGNPLPVDRDVNTTLVLATILWTAALALTLGSIIVNDWRYLGGAFLAGQAANTLSNRWFLIRQQSRQRDHFDLGRASVARDPSHPSIGRQGTNS